MREIPHLLPLERRVLLGIPQLFPEGDSDDHQVGASREHISCAINGLIGMKLVSASYHQGVNPLAPYYCNVELTPEGTQLVRYMARPVVVRFLQSEWRWVLTTAMSLVALVVSVWTALHR